MDKYCVIDVWEESHGSSKNFTSWARELESELSSSKATLALIFWTTEFSQAAGDLAEDLQLSLKIPVVAGCSVGGLIAKGIEMEDKEGVVVQLFDLPDTIVKSYHIDSQTIGKLAANPEAVISSPFSSNKTNSFLCFLSSGSSQYDSFLKSWDSRYPKIPVFGGLACGQKPGEKPSIYLNGRISNEGGIILGLEGKVSIKGATAQGCLPIGDPGPVTKKFQNRIEEIGNRPAFKVLAETINKLSAQDQQEIKGNLFMGLAFNEYKEVFKEGDFLIRNLVEVDPVSGCLGVAADIRTGQTIQFQKRDAEAASREMESLLSELKQSLENNEIIGEIMINCVGRGKGLFQVDNHDSGLAEKVLGQIPMAGFFSVGEIGPVGDSSFLHSYSSTIGLFTLEKPAA